MARRYIDLDVLLERLSNTYEEYVYEILDGMEVVVIPDEMQVIDRPDDYIVVVEKAD